MLGLGNQQLLVSRRETPWKGSLFSVSPKQEVYLQYCLQNAAKCISPSLQLLSLPHMMSQGQPIVQIRLTTVVHWLSGHCQLVHVVFTSCFSRAASVMSQKMADLVLASMADPQ